LICVVITLQIFALQELENVTEFCLTLSQDGNRTSYENEIQSDVATLKKYQTLAGSLPALFIAPILGAWADGSGGRKYPLLISLLSPCLVSGLTLITTVIRHTVFILIYVPGLLFFDPSEEGAFIRDGTSIYPINRNHNFFGYI
jgi:MFS-type transporter involved in bile tolerance (Atg22 family)